MQMAIDSSTKIQISLNTVEGEEKKEEVPLI